MGVTFFSEQVYLLFARLIFLNFDRLIKFNSKENVGFVS